MTSNLECVGLGVADSAGLERLIHAALGTARPLGEAHGITVVRWQDPSGARLVLAMRGNEVLDVLPSYAGTPGARLGNVWSANEEVTVADVLDQDGEQVTMLALELEQRRLLAERGGPAGGVASVVALGVDVSVHADEDAFSLADASLMRKRGEDPGAAPPQFVSRGLLWPPRMAAESFISHGVFGPPEHARAYARLNGTVLSAQRRVVVATGQPFLVARVRTAGFEVDLCLSAHEFPHPPQAGNVIGGTVFLVASMEA